MTPCRGKHFKDNLFLRLTVKIWQFDYIFVALMLLQDFKIVECKKGICLNYSDLILVINELLIMSNNTLKALF